MSDPKFSREEPANMIYISAEMVIALASVLGNVLVVLVVYINRDLSNTTFSFIASLAVADIAVGGLVIPLAIVVHLGFNTQFCTCLVVSCLLLVITQSSILSLLAIAIDRYLRIKIPTRYGDIVTRGRAYVAICLCWTLSFLSGFVPLMGWNNASQGNCSNSSEITCTFETVIKMDYMVYFNFFGFVVVPLTIMIILYGEIFWVIRKQLNRRAEATCDAQKYYRKELKLAKSLALVLFLFIFCWMPIHVINCINFFCSNLNMHKSVVLLGIVMSHVNSAINPMIYAFRIERFQLTLIQIFRRCMFCRSVETPYLTSTPGVSERTNVNF